MFVETKDLSKEAENAITPYWNVRASNRARKILRRCNDKNAKDYHIYGGRGITCDLSINQIVSYLKKMIDDKLKELGCDSNYINRIIALDHYDVDRIDSNLGYTLENMQLLEREVNCLYTKENACHVMLPSGLFCPLFILDQFLGLRKKYFVCRLRIDKRIRGGFALMYHQKKRRWKFPLLWGKSLSEKPAVVKGDKLICVCGKESTFNVLGDFKCDCGFEYSFKSTKGEAHKTTTKMMPKREDRNAILKELRALVKFLQIS